MVRPRTTPDTGVAIRQPLVTPATATFDERLVGSWHDAKRGDRAVVRRGSANAYVIDYRDGDGESATFAARLGRLRDRLVLDVRMVPRQRDKADPYAPFFFTGHALLVLDIGDGEIRASEIGADSLKARLRSGRLRAPHVLDEDRVLLTGTTAQLRTLIGDFLRRPGALTTATVWRRVEAKPGAATVSSASGAVIPLHAGTPLLFCRAPGLSVNIKIDSTSTGATRFAAGTGEVAAGGENAGAHSTNDEAIYFLSAGGRAFVGSDSTDIQPGVMLYVPQGVGHGFASPPDGPVRFVWMIAPQALARAFRSSGVPPGTACPDSAPR